MFITFEGVDGSGKSTIIQKLKIYLLEKYSNLNFIFTREPGGDNLKEAEKIRELILDKDNNFDPMTEAILFLASRRLHLEQIIWPALKENKIVICDRYIDSSVAYQGAGKGIGVKKIKDLNDLITENTQPKYTFLFDLPMKEAEKRLFSFNKGNADRMEKNNQAFFETVYECYKDLAAKENDRFIVINASQEVEDVFREVKIHIDMILSKVENEKK